MIMDVFIDTDVILDFLVTREPFSEHAIRLFHKVDTGEIRFFLSATSVTNLYYILRRGASHRKVITGMNQLITMGTILEVNREVIDQAINSSFSDFEDAVQYYCAKQNPGITHLITRNIRDYKGKALIVTTPELLVKSI